MGRSISIGRPKVVTSEVLRKLDIAFALGCTDVEACIVAGISKSALYDHQSQNPEFVERKELLKVKPVLRARQTVVKALAKDPALALKYLERKKRDEFSTRIESTGADGGPIRQEYVEVTPECLRALAKTINDEF